MEDGQNKIDVFIKTTCHSNLKFFHFISIEIEGAMKIYLNMIHRISFWLNLLYTSIDVFTEKMIRLMTFLPKIYSSSNDFFSPQIYYSGNSQILLIEWFFWLKKIFNL